MSKPTERVEACLRACDGLTTVDLAGNKRGWLAELCQDAVKLDEPYRAGAQKCLQIVKEMRESLVRSDGTDYGILSRVEYRLQKVVDAPIAPSTTLTEQDIQRFRVGDILFSDEQAKMFCDLAQKGLRAQGAAVPAQALEDACNIALAISGHFCENPDEWLRGHEKTLRDLQETARAALTVAPSATTLALKAEQVEWVVNDIAELGVKIGDQFFWLYKGRSLVYGSYACSEQKDGVCLHDNGTPMHWRPVGKREFGECANPVNYADLRACGHAHYVGTVSLVDSDEWKQLPISKVKHD